MNQMMPITTEEATKFGQLRMYPWMVCSRPKGTEQWHPETIRRWQVREGAIESLKTELAEGVWNTDLFEFQVWNSNTEEAIPVS